MSVSPGSMYLEMLAVLQLLCGRTNILYIRVFVWRIGTLPSISTTGFIARRPRVIGTVLIVFETLRKRMESHPRTMAVKYFSITPLRGVMRIDSLCLCTFIPFPRRRDVFFHIYIYSRLSSKNLDLGKEKKKMQIMRKRSHCKEAIRYFSSIERGKK